VKQAEYLLSPHAEPVEALPRNFRQRTLKNIFLHLKKHNVMRAVQFDTTGNPADVLVLRDVPTPTPAAGEVLIRAKVRAINPSDVAFIKGAYGIKPHPPCGAGFEGMGVIEAHGEGVDPARYPKEMRVSFTAMNGVWQEYITATASTLIPLPDAISDETGAQMIVNPFTAWAMLHECGLQSGDWLMLTAGASAFSQLVLQLAVQRGINVICTVRRDDVTEQLKTMGAAAVINTATEDLRVRVKELTKYGVKAVLEAIGGEAGAQALECLTRNGIMLIYGMLSWQPIPMHSGLMIFKHLTVRGFWLTTWMQTAPAELQRTAAKELLTLFATGKLTASVDATFDLADFKEAVIRSETPGRAGKILLVG
jgi:NADPH:quinone reductase-like Zn-dependent oxidoreductase